MLDEEKGQMKVFVPKKRKEHGGIREKCEEERPQILSSGMLQEQLP